MEASPLNSHSTISDTHRYLIADKRHLSKKHAWSQSALQRVASAAFPEAICSLPVVGQHLL